MQQSNYRGGGGQRYNGGAKTALTGQTGGLAPAANAPDRKFIDPGSAMVRELTEIRPYFSENSYNDPQLALSIGPSKIFQRLLPLPFSRAARPFPEMSFTTRHCHTCINKSRCPINVVRWTPDGRRLVSGASSGDLTIWSSLGFMNESTIGAHATAIRALEWSKTGDFMLSGDNDGAIKIFNPQFGLQKESETAHTSSVRGLSFSPTDSKFASCSDDLSVKIWDFDTLKEERKLNGHGFDVKSVSWHPFKALVLSGGRDNLVKLWDPRASDEVLTISGHKKSVSLVSWNPHNGNWFCSTSRDRSVRIYDIRMLGAANRRANAGGGASSESGDRALHVLTAHSSEVYAAAWHPEHEDLLATGGYDGSLLFWLIKSRVDDADAVTPVEEALARGANGAANLSERSCEEPRVQASVPAAHENAIWTMDWHPTGHMLCTGSNDHTCKFWSRMRPGATVDDYYGGFQRDISEVDILRELNLLPPVSPLEEELVKRRLAEQELDTEKEGKENCGPYSEAIELLGSVKIPGVGVVETECSTKHIGPILMPIEAARKPVYLPEIAEATIANFTTDLIETLERGKLLSAEVGGVRANHEVAAVSSGSDRQGGGVKRNFESGPGGDASQARASTDISNLPGTRLCGTVKHWNDKGYGFIKPDASGMEDLYAHATDIVDGFGSGGEQKLDRGDRVVFRHEVGENKVTGKAQVKAKEIVCARYYVEAGISLPSDNSGDSSTPANGSGNPQSAAAIPNQSFGQQQQPHGAQPMHGNHQRPHNNNMGQPPPGHMGQPPPGHMGQPPPGHMGQPPPGHMGQPPPGHMGQPPPSHMGQPPPGHMGQPPPGHMGQPPPGHMGQPPQQHQFQQGHMGAPPQQHQFQQGFNGNPPPMTADRKHHILSILQKAQGSSNPAEISQALAQYGISHDELAQVMAHDQGSGNY